MLRGLQRHATESPVHAVQVAIKHSGGSQVHQPNLGASNPRRAYAGCRQGDTSAQHREAACATPSLASPRKRFGIPYFAWRCRIGSPGVSSPRLPQHPACGSARGVSAGLEKAPLESASKAGYDTVRHDRFTCAGAIRPLRSARLTLCRRFGPSPCPTHYGGRLANTPSADRCAITPGVATVGAARIVVGTGGCSTPIDVALSPVPVAITVTLGFDGASRLFNLGLSSTPIAARAARCTALPE